MVGARVVIIMPAHNEAQNLSKVLAELRQHLPADKFQSTTIQGVIETCLDADVVVIDDYSNDETAAVAVRLGAQVVSLPCNLGYGGAVQTGFKYAVERGYDYAVMLDADGQHDPSYVPALLAPVIAGEADVAIGSRFLGTVDYKVSWPKRVGMRIFAAIVAHFSKRPVTDPTSGFQALNRDALRFFARDNYPSDYPDADTLLLLNYAGFRVVEVPVRMRERLTGLSMHSSWRVFYYIFKVFLAIFIVLLRQKTRGNAHRRARR